jgi:alpha-galactosidase/6-phospho-beta-glucosidase family protein
MTTEKLQAEVTRLNAIILQKNKLIQQQSDKLKETEEELKHFITSSSEAMKLIDTLRREQKILVFINKRLKGVDIYDHVIAEINATIPE